MVLWAVVVQLLAVVVATELEVLPILGITYNNKLEYFIKQKAIGLCFSHEAVIVASSGKYLKPCQTSVLELFEKIINS